MQCKLASEKGFQLAQQSDLVFERQLDVDALNAIGIVAEPLQRNDDVLIDLECVGVARDSRCARAVQPEALARFRTHGDEPFPPACVSDAYYARRNLSHRLRIVAHD